MLTTVRTSICWPFKRLTSPDCLEKDLKLSAQGKEHNYAEQVSARINVIHKADNISSVIHLPAEYQGDRQY